MHILTANTGEMIQEIGIGKYFMNRVQKAQLTQTKTDK